MNEHTLKMSRAIPDRKVVEHINGGDIVVSMSENSVALEMLLTSEVVY
jgi:hypothetical protein